MRRRGPGIAGAVPLATVLLVAGALPFASALVDSLFHDVYGERSFAGLDNYRFLFADRAFALSALITLAWAAASAAICAVSGFALATTLRDSGRGGRIAYLALLVPWGVPAFIGIPLWRMLFHGSGGDSIMAALFGIRVDLMTDPAASFAAAVFVNGWMSAPLAAFAAFAALQKIPKAEVEAARLDGAGPAALAFRIYLPHARGALLAIGALEFVRSFKEFNLPFLFTAGGPPLLGGITRRSVVGATTTLEIYLYDLFQSSDDYGRAAAYAAVLAAATAAFLGSWNAFLAPLILLTDDAMYTIGVKLYAYVGSVASGAQRWNRFAAASIVNLVVVGAVMLRAKGPLRSDAAANQDE